MKLFLKIFVISLVAYVLISFLVLGRFTYWTSSNESSISASKQEKIFISEDLKVETKGDSLKIWNNKYSIWTNKRSETKFYGIIFHQTFKEDNWRYLNIEPINSSARNNYAISKLRINDYEKDYMKNFTGGFQLCCNRIACEVGDTVIVNLFDFKREEEIGELKILIK